MDIWYKAQNLDRFSEIEETYFSLFLGPKLPFRVYGSAMVTSPNNKGVILIGGYIRNDHVESSALLELSGNSVESLQWTILEQKLKHPRCNHVALFLPQNLLKAAS